MINQTLAQIEARLAAAENLRPENREALTELVGQLREEVAQLTGDQQEHAASIAGFTDGAAREALRTQQDPALLDLSLQGLESSVREFEVSHPRLTSVVNAICHQLSSLGI